MRLFIILLISLTSLSIEAQFASHLITDDFDSPDKGILADLDMDGDLDILFQEGGLQMCINEDGKGDYSTPTLISGISGSAAAAVDVDGDDDMDIIMIHNKNIIVIENINGDASEWEPRTISSFSTSGTYNFAYIEDIDGGGDLDIANAAMKWFENLDGHFMLSEERELFELPNDYDVSRNIHPTDWDQDGDYDMIINIGIELNKSHIYLLENDGSNNYTPIILKDSINSLDGLTFSKLADVDNDGDQDLVVHGGPNDIGWYKNEEGILSDFIFVHEYFDIPGNMRLVDINADGDIDLFWCGHPGIFWKENLGGFTFDEVAKQVGSYGIDATNDIVFGDIDGDDDMDLLDLGRTISNFNQDIRWHENKIEQTTVSTDDFKKRGTIYPNPASSVLFIPQVDSHTVILDLQGRSMLTTNKTEIDVSGFPTGVYFVRMHLKDKIRTEKVIIF